MANAILWLKHPSGKRLYLGKRYGDKYEYTGQEHLEDILNVFFAECWDAACEDGTADTQDDFYIRVD